MKALHDALPGDAEHIDGYYQKLGQFYNSLNENEKKLFHKNAQQAKASSPAVAQLFNDPTHKADLKKYLEEKAGIQDVPANLDMMDTAFF